ncbi:SIMPL domain-containing protein [Aggregatimonas sangjinii]|uniref:SIMPL domain-containing protein n=1 Tax=Aggregatimonas sangjinii TaxID=2583587 RepID=A0A5B7SN17_9FLAO|nr:SIMPL domain-containing protein [Aggregatimonas sangjinii]QCX00055.1 SIMPL domain-containing protein [Aggregatimonas sangjinii]
MKNYLSASIISLTVLISVILFTRAYHNRHRSNDIIHVTGLGAKDFKSDLVIWSGGFDKSGKSLEEASRLLQTDKEIIRQYLLAKGVKDAQIVFSALDIQKDYSTIYFENGGIKEQRFEGFILRQTVKIESNEVDKIEEISRSITELTDKGIGFYSNRPQYYYTKLSELKIEMVAAATEDARIRAEQIAQNANASIENLRYAKMGIFQIIAQNSNEDLSWGGTFNTSSKMKTATITMKLQFGL